MRIRPRLATALATVLLSPLVAVLPAHAVGPTTMTAAQLTDAFRTYGDTSGLWNGGDSTASVALPDGRVVWLFSDTFIGPINSDGSRPSGQPMIHNSMIVQQDGVLASTLTGGTAAEPLSLVGTATDVNPGDMGHWVGDATVEGTTLQVLYNHYRSGGGGPLDLSLTGTALASFDLPALTLRTVVPLPLSDRIAWGSAILEDGATTYIYGTGMAPDLGSIKPVYLAKVAAGQISGAWQFWTGTGWSDKEAAAGMLMSGVGTAFGVEKVGSEYVLVTVDGNAVFNPDVVAYRASSAAGPFTGPVPLFRAPEPQPGKQTIVYDARVHPEWATAGKLLVSYNVNSLDGNDNKTDARLYRARFADVTWPPPTPSGLPAAPGGITAAANTSGAVHLGWSAVSGATGYRVFQRDVASGQSHFLRLATTVTTTGYDVTGLTDGHLYEFSVSAVNAVGEGARGSTVSAVARTTNPTPGAFVAAQPGNAVTGAYLVDLKDNAAAGEGGVAAVAARLVATYGGTLGSVYAAVLGGFSVTGMTDAQAHALAADPAVATVEEARAGLVSASDPGTQQSAPWGLDRIDGVLDGKYVYPSTGQGSRIYIVDSGVRLSHNDFGGRASLFSSQWSDPNDNSCKSHGTFVAAIAGGSNVGVAKKATILDAQAGCEPDGYTTAQLVAALNSIARNGTPGSVVNVSMEMPALLGGADSVVKATEETIGAGFTVVVAAGNYAINACNTVPANVPEAITVGATDIADTLWFRSNKGPCVDIFAPGDAIQSATNQGDSQYVVASGTSAAAPHVSGAAALILAAHPTYTPEEVALALEGLAERDAVKGDLGDAPNRLLRLDSSLTAAPAGLTATPASDGTIALAWQPVSVPGVNYLVSQRDVTAGQTWFRWTNPIRTGTTATTGALEPGHVYEFTVAAANTMAVSPESNVASATAFILPPAAPTGLTAVAKPGGVITLAWTAPGPDLWYWIYQRDVTAGEADFTQLPYPITTCCTMDAGYLINGHVYEYQVSAINRAGEGPRSAPAQATAVVAAPSPPTNLRATPGDAQATLTWNAPASGDLWYLVYQRNATDNGQWQQLPLPITSCCTMNAAYLDNGDTYEFKVTATSNGGESLASNVVSVRPLPPLPAAPTGLTATALESGEIRLSWTAAPTNVYYWVYMRDVTAGQTTFTKSQYPTDRTSATMGLLTNGHTYEFKLTAENLAGQGPACAPVQARSQVALPKAPTDLTAVGNKNLEIRLTWQPPGPNMYYWVYMRDVTAGQTTFTKSIYPTTATNAQMGMLTNGHTYEFKVTAENSAGEGPASLPASAKATGTVPNPPGTLSATPGDGSVRLNWLASTTANVGYYIYYRDATANGSWQRMPYPVTSCCTYTVTFLVNGHTYEFNVTAGNAAGESDYTNTVTAKPLPPFPQPPTNLRATAGNNQVTLAWNASPTPSVYYWIEYRVAGGTWHRLQYPLGTCCTFTVTYLANGTTYEFRVRSNNVAGDSAPSNVDSARPMPPFPQPPSNLTATAGDGKVTIRWSASSTSGVYYVVDYRTSNGTWQRMPYPVTTCCSLVVSYLMNGTTYQFRVRAANLSGESTATNIASARPMPPFPQPPRNLTATTAPTTGEIKLSWTASPTPNVYYWVYQRNYTRNGAWIRLPYPTNARSMTAGYLIPGDIYSFKITAFNLAGESAPSNMASEQARYADGTISTASVSSSWVLQPYGEIVPVQRWDVGATVQGTRNGNYIQLSGNWQMYNGKQLLVGLFGYSIIDCTTNALVKYDSLAYPNGTSSSSGGIYFSYLGNPHNQYRVRVIGQGDITYSTAISGRFSMQPPHGIVPFVTETSCI